MELSYEYTSGNTSSAVSAIDIEWAQIDRAHHRVISEPEVDEDGSLAYIMLVNGFKLPHLRSSHEMIERAKAALRKAETLGPEIHADLLMTVGAAARERDDRVTDREFTAAGIELIRSARAEIGEAKADELLTKGLRSLGSIEQRLGNNTVAQRTFDEALTIARTNQLEEEEGQILGDMAVLLSESGDYISAIAKYEQALAIARRHNDVEHIEIWSGNLANSLQEIGRYADAKRAAHEALSLARGLGNRREEGRQLGILGTINRKLGNIEDALQDQLIHYRIAAESGDRFSKASALEELANNYRATGRLEEAATAFDDAATLLYEIGRPHLAIRSAANACLVRADAGEPETALPQLRELVRAIRTVGDDNLISECIGHLSHVLRLMNRLPEARAVLNEAIDLAPADSDLLVNQLGNLAELHQLEGDLITAANIYRSIILKCPLGHGRDRARGIALANLGGITLHWGSRSEARRIYKEALVALRTAKAPEISKVAAELNAIDGAWT